MNDEDDLVRGSRAHPKNTKRWCKGKAGVEHVTEIAIPSNAFSLNRPCHPSDSDSDWAGWEINCGHVELCVNCGKHIRSYLNKGECPSRSK